LVETQNNNFSIFINTTDSFEDCWYPFFKLFNTFWKRFTGKIYLNTENKSFEFQDLNIISIKNANLLHGKPTWGKSLKAALDFIPEDIILYLQEDYFINDKVNTAFINDAFQIMLHDTKIGCIHLTDQATAGPFEETDQKNFKIISDSADYRISCQAALWRKDCLKKYIRSYETPWQFELIGTKRSKFIFKDLFLIVNPDEYGVGTNEILPYVFTGIIKGKWKIDVCELFKKNNIAVDFSKRGFSTDGFINKTKLPVKAKNFISKTISSVEILIKRVLNNRK
jgi:hypothetical protein